MNRTTILITIPKKKLDPTEYTSQWAEKAYKLIKSLGYNVIALRGENTTYYNVTAVLQKYHPKVYIHYGHGCPSSINGQNECVVTRKFSIDELMLMGEKDPEKLDKLLNPVKLSGCGKDICQLQNNLCAPLCLKDTNIDLLKGSIIYAVSCHSAEKLGKCAIQHGVQSYVGYRDLLLFPVDQMQSQNLFGEVHLSFIKELLEGKTVGEANEAMKRVETTYIKLYKDVKWVGLPLLWNALHRDVLGDHNARIY